MRSFALLYVFFGRYAARQQANLAPLYFLAFMVFGSMVMLNLFIAVVIVSGGHAWWRRCLGQRI